MLVYVVLAGFLLPQQAAMRCVDSGSKIAATQTQPLRGPSRLIAVLKASTADDHGKNTHLCNAEYVLLISSGTAGTAKVINLITTDGDWQRTLSLKLTGFSHDGRRVYGVLKENGKYPSTTLFDYDTVDGKVYLIDLEKQFANLVTAGCQTTFGIRGTTDMGAIVMEVKSAKACAANGSWVLDATGGSIHRFPEGASVQSLFTSEAATK